MQRQPFRRGPRGSVPGALALVCLVALGSSCASTSPYSTPGADVDDFDAAGQQPPSAETLYALAGILSSQGKHEQGKFVLGRTIQDHPDFLPAYIELAEHYANERRPHEAIHLLDLALEQAPRDPVALNNRGLCRLVLREHDLAAADFGLAAARSGGKPSRKFRSNLALVLGLLGRYDEALSLYRQVVIPEEAHHNLAVVCEARGDGVRADAEYARADELRKERLRRSPVGPR